MKGLRIFILAILSSQLLSAAAAIGYVVISDVFYDTPFNEDYNTPAPYHIGEYLKITNLGNAPADLGHCKITSTTMHRYSYEFEEHTTIAPGGSIILYNNGGVDTVTIHGLFRTGEIGPNDTIIYHNSLVMRNSHDIIRLIKMNSNSEETLDIVEYGYTGYSLKAHNGVGLPPSQCVTLRRVANFEGHCSTQFLADEFATVAANPFSRPNVKTYRGDNLLDLPPVNVFEAVNSNGNYIAEAVMTAAHDIDDFDEDDAIVTVNYFDGLGRQQQEIHVRASASGSDIADFTEYNQRGKPCAKWLPTASLEAGGSQMSLQALLTSYPTVYPNDTHWSTTSAYESSVECRTIETKAAGDLWQAHGGVSTEYLTNTADQSDMKCIDFRAATDGTLTKHGTYPTGSLHVTRVTDEDGNVTANFTDMQDSTVLVRRKLGSQWLDTYYVRDDWGNLCWVLPPAAAITLKNKADGTITDQTTLDKLCFRRTYDHRNRVTSSKLPGCEPVYYVYDRCDNIVYSQDGVQRQGKKWTFTMRDKFGRVVYSGQTVDTRTVEQLRAAWAGISPRAERADGENAVGYTIPTELTGITARKINLVNYYDDYGFIANFAVNQQQMLTYDEMEGYDGRYDTAGSGLTARGRLTGTAARVLSGTSTTTTLLPTAFYYDIHGNVIQTRAVNHRGGRDVERRRLTFTGKPLTVRREHTSGAAVTTPAVEVYNYTYDQVERPLTCSLSVDGGTAMQLSAAYYNELGQTAETELLDAVATISYGYNVRGWVSSIGCGNIFSQNLYYADAPSGATARYGGDVSANYWRCGTSEQVGMRYGYDGVGRLTQARDLNPLSDCSTTFTYDMNGNMTQMQRKGVSQKIHHLDPITHEDIYICLWGVIDNVTLNYDGNRLVKADDARAALTYAGAMDFRDGADETTEYLWDADGRLTCDLNKGIYEVQYNLIGLPSKTHFFNGNIIYTDYAADGRKLQTRYVYDSNEVAVIESQSAPSQAAVPTDMDGLFAGMAAVGGGAAQPDGGLVPGGGIEPEPLVQLLGKRDYCGSRIYLNDTIERVLTPVGYYNELGDHYAYVKDWQGNVRVTIDQNGNVIEAVDYYPYGMVMEKDNEIATDAQPYKYGGKELDRRFGYDSYDFEARVYDPAVGRFTTPDPLAWDTPDVSPYVYCAGNPIRYIDPTGETIQFNGNQEDLLLVLDILNKTVGDYYQFTLNEKNELEMNSVDGADLSQMDKSQQMVANTMQQMIYNGFTSINVDHQSNEYIIGRNETNSIDISDINAIGSGDKPMTSIGALTHEMYENHLTQTMGLDLNAAHKKASTLEGKVTGYYISPYSRNFSASGVSVFNVDFPKNSGKVILYHSNNNLLYILHNR